jgi:archaellum component FlaG (FlaF/FlaG flagellin family)
MLKKILFLSLFVIFISFFTGCSKDTVTNSPVFTTQGFLVLCEGDFSTPGDYSFINTKNDSVSNNVFANSNSGATLGKFPDGIALNLSYLYITSQGNYGGPGKMYRLTQSDNKLVNASIDFGTNPYDMVLANNYFYITNTGGSTVSKVSQTLDVLNPGITVGPNPSKIITAMHSVYVAKQTYTLENSVGIINFFNDAVTKTFLPGPPVSVAFNEGVVLVLT